jgi:hypothetical protein
MFETYRMLGEQRELELLREARRLHAGRAVKDSGVRRAPRRRLWSLFRSKANVLPIGFLSSTERGADRPAPQL